MATSQGKQRGDTVSVPVRYPLRVLTYHLFTCNLHLQKRKLRDRVLSRSNLLATEPVLFSLSGVFSPCVLKSSQLGHHRACWSFRQRTLKIISSFLYSLSLVHCCHSYSQWFTIATNKCHLLQKPALLGPNGFISCWTAVSQLAMEYGVSRAL